MNFTCKVLNLPQAYSIARLDIGDKVCSMSFTSQYCSHVLTLFGFLFRRIASYDACHQASERCPQERALTTFPSTLIFKICGLVLLGLVVCYNC